MATYSIGVPPNDATKLQDFQSVLDILPDNTAKLISPKDVRDSAYTIWENIIYKPTNAGGPEYIGMDSDSYSNKVYFGKKRLNGQYVMNNALLATDIDFFFYNTATNSLGQYNTKVAFMAGTAFGTNLPYIRAIDFSNSPYTNTIDLEIKNTSYYVAGSSNAGGNIILESDWGNIILNGVRWPDKATNLLGTQTDYVLKYKWIAGSPYAVWEPNSTASISSLYSSTQVTITSPSVLVNNFPLEFSDSLPTPTAFGGIPAGSTFSNVALVEMIRQMLYPYIAPRLTTFLNYTLIEIGDVVTQNNLRFNWQIIKNSTYSIPNTFMTTPYTGTLPTNITANGLTSGQLTPTFNFGSIQFDTLSASYWTSSTWTFSLADTYPTSVTSSSTIRYVLPWYYGSSLTLATQSNAVGSILATNSIPGPNILKKALFDVATATTSSNKVVELTTLIGSTNQAYVYFGYPAVYPDLLNIRDQNGFDVTGAFRKFTVTGLNSPGTPLTWGAKDYKFYIYVGVTSAPGPTQTTISVTPPFIGTFSFNFA